MRVVVAPDAFKGSASAAEAAAAMARGIRSVAPDAEVVELPIADGGEGTLDVLAQRTESVEVTHATGSKTNALLGWRSTDAIVEVAQAVGLPSVPADARDPWALTSAGVGELIGRAVADGARRVFVALGGSATVDGGAGLLAALGAGLLDDAGTPLGARPGEWADRLARVDVAPARRALQGAELIGLYDVTSPLLGEGGARIFMVQKGVALDALDAMEAALARLAAVSGMQPLQTLPGTGAAGGIGFALAALGGSLVSGADCVLELVGLERALENVELLITGEGSFDAQSLVGKATGTVLARAQARSVPVAIICGQGSLTGYEVRAIGAGLPLAEAMRRAPELIARAAADLVRCHLGG